MVATQFHELKAEMNKMRDLERYSFGLKNNFVFRLPDANARENLKGFKSLCKSTSSAQKAHC